MGIIASCTLSDDSVLWEGTGLYDKVFASGYETCYSQGQQIKPPLTKNQPIRWFTLTHVWTCRKLLKMIPRTLFSGLPYDWVDTPGIRTHTRAGDQRYHYLASTTKLWVYLSCTKFSRWKYSAVTGRTLEIVLWFTNIMSSISKSDIRFLFKPIHK